MNGLPDMDSARWFAALARDLAEQSDRDTTALRLLELITGATGCSVAAIAHLSPSGALFYDHGTDPELIATISAISTSTGEGWPGRRCVSVPRSGPTI